MDDDTAEYVPLLDWSREELMPTDAENAATALSQAWARVAELDTVPLTQRARMTYSDDNGRTLGWGEYRQQLISMIEKLQGSGTTAGLVQGAQGPFTVFG